MKIKQIFALVFAVALAFVMAVPALAASGFLPDESCNHADLDGDSLCDECLRCYDGIKVACIDLDGDFVCDVCPYLSDCAGVGHSDNNNDGICDRCDFNLSVSDSTEPDTTEPTEDETLPDDGGGSDTGSYNEPPDWDKAAYPYGFIIKNPSAGTYTFYAYSTPLVRDSEGLLRINGPCTGIACGWTDSGWNSFTDLSYDADFYYRFDAGCELVFASFNVYNVDGTLFFPVPSTLTGVLTTTSMSGVMTEVVALLPVGLLCGIGYLALRKGLRILVEILYQA